jgi:uncharacterized protein YjbI with pentapeptide repeats
MEGDNMANPEHLTILKKGVQTWNEWRSRNPLIRPDLCEAPLGRMNLNGVNLSRANLRKANLIAVSLSNADLSEAILDEAQLNGANLAGANLKRAGFRNTKLGKNPIRETLGGRPDMWMGYVVTADLSNTDISDADLEGADLSGANLSNAVLTKASLCRADLNEADLSRTDLRNASLSEADLSEADLREADLRGANLQYCQLCRCNLQHARLTGASLYASAREDWNIAGVRCEYIFWDINREHRSPRDRCLGPNEFERLYGSLPTIEYIFQNGMTPIDPLVMDWVVQAIRERNQEYDIKIDSISARGLAPSIKFTVLREEQKEAALAEVTKVFEAKVHELAGRLDEARSFIQLLIDRPNSVHIQNPIGPLAIGGSTINIDQHVEYITNLRDAVAAVPEDSPTFAKVAKNTAMDLIGLALKDVAKGQIKEAAKQIYELGKDLGPVIVNTAAYGFFKSCLGL